MSYATSTISSSTPAQALMDVLDAAIVAVTGWTLVEKYTISGSAPASNNVQYVYKSSGATNSFGTDFYLWMFRTSDQATTVYFGVAESYATGTHKFIKFPPYSGNSLVIQADYTVGVVSTSDVVAAGTNMFTFTTVTLNTSGFTYWYSITKDRLVITTLVGTLTYSQYLGLYDSFFAAGSDPFPLMQSPLYMYSTNPVDTSPQQIQSRAAALTREPGLLSPISHQNSYDFQGALGGWTPFSPNYRGCIDSKWWAGRICVGSNYTPGKIRGLLKPDVLYCYTGAGYAMDHNTSGVYVQNQASVTPATGDTLVIDGVNYTCLGRDGSNAATPIWVNTTV